MFLLQQDFHIYVPYYHKFDQLIQSVVIRYILPMFLTKPMVVTAFTMANHTNLARS